MAPLQCTAIASEHGDLVFDRTCVSEGSSSTDGGIERGSSPTAEGTQVRVRTGFDGAIRGGILTLVSTEISELVTQPTHETVYDLEVDGSHSFVTEVCVVHNCGGGTLWGYNTRLTGIPMWSYGKRLNEANDVLGMRYEKTKNSGRPKERVTSV